MQYDKILEAFGINAAAYLGALFYLEYISTSADDRRLITTWLSLTDDGPGTAISGYLTVDGGTHVGDAPAICATEGFIDAFAGSAEHIKGLLGVLNLAGTDVSILARALEAVVTVTGGTIERVVALLAPGDRDWETNP